MDMIVFKALICCHLRRDYMNLPDFLWTRRGDPEFTLGKFALYSELWTFILCQKNENSNNEDTSSEDHGMVPRTQLLPFLSNISRLYMNFHIH